jgi:hypothetical protein
MLDCTPSESEDRLSPPDEEDASVDYRTYFPLSWLLKLAKDLAKNILFQLFA